MGPHDTEIWIIQILGDGDATATELMDEIGVSQAVINGHLAHLHQLGLVVSYISSTLTIQKLTDDGLLLCDKIYGGVSRETD